MPGAVSGFLGDFRSAIESMLTMLCINYPKLLCIETIEESTSVLLLSHGIREILKAIITIPRELYIPLRKIEKKDLNEFGGIKDLRIEVGRVL
jgi:hypothetical protein